MFDGVVATGAHLFEPSAGAQLDRIGEAITGLRATGERQRAIRTNDPPLFAGVGVLDDMRRPIAELAIDTTCPQFGRLDDVGIRRDHHGSTNRGIGWLMSRASWDRDS